MLCALNLRACLGTSTTSLWSGRLVNVWFIRGMNLGVRISSLWINSGPAFEVQVGIDILLFEGGGYL